MSCSASIPHSPHPTRPARAETAFCQIVGGLIAAALEYMRGHGLAGPVMALLDAHPAKLFADATAWTAHLARLGIDTLAVTPDPMQIATQGALWGAICHHGLLTSDATPGAAGTVIVSDGAGQFRVGLHALCWVHAERLVHKLVPATPEQRQAVRAVQRCRIGCTEPTPPHM